jgi:hypothetical protein
MDRDVYNLTEQALSTYVRSTLYREPWSDVERTLGPLIREVQAKDPGYGDDFAGNMVLAAQLLDSFASDAAQAVASGREPVEVSQRLHLQLEQLKTSVSVKTDTGARKQAAMAALNRMKALTDWNYVEEHAL